MWIWEQYGRLLRAPGAFVAHGYAGFGTGRNNPGMQQIHDIGPLPCGLYKIIGPPKNDPHTGKDTLYLEPFPENEMFGRSGFRIHGDNIEHAGKASKGCPVLPNAVRWEVWSSGDHVLQVVPGVPPAGERSARCSSFV